MFNNTRVPARQNGWVLARLGAGSGGGWAPERAVLARLGASSGAACWRLLSEKRRGKSVFFLLSRGYFLVISYNSI